MLYLSDIFIILFIYVFFLVLIFKSLNTTLELLNTRNKAIGSLLSISSSYNNIPIQITAYLINQLYLFDEEY